MKQLTLFLLFFVQFNLFAQTPELIFHSGFEPSVDTFDHESDDVDLIGIDGSVSAPNDWELDLDDHPNIGYFKIQFQGGEATDRIAHIAPDPVDPNNNTLKFWIKNPNSGNNGRIQGNIYNNNGIYKLFYSVRLFLPGDFNLLKVIDDDFNFLTLMEFWNNANWTEEDYMFRIKVNIAKVLETEDSLKIRLTGQMRDVELDKWGEDVYDIINPDFVMPVQKWMTIKIYFVEGDDCTGRFILSITPDGDPETIVHDIRNFTHHPDDPNPDGLSQFNPMKLYSDDEIVEYVRDAGGFLQVYWDDFEFWKDSVYVDDDSCLPMGITFESQSDIDDFATNYPGCRNIEGNVTIESGTLDPINDLGGLSQLTSIQRTLKIESNNNLTNLSGLENLTCINGNLQIESNSSLTDISALSNIWSLGGGLKIESNSSLNSLNGFENLRAINGSLTISDNDNLTSLTGLESINYNSITNLFIQNSSVLSFCQLENICQYLDNGGTATISGNTGDCATLTQVDAACLLVLPVELTYFSGREDAGSSVLKWQTASETNNDYFEVEHSVDGRTFKVIGKVEGHGTTVERQDYQFIHKFPEPGLNYYRLKQVDFDGGFENSEIININIESDHIVVQPNPTNGLVEISVSNLEQTSFKVTDGMGRIIQSDKITGTQTINLSDHPKGIYFFIFQTAYQTIVKRIVKS